MVEKFSSSYKQHCSHGSPALTPAEADQRQIRYMRDDGWRECIANRTITESRTAIRMVYIDQ